MTGKKKTQITRETMRKYERIVSATADYISLVDTDYRYQLLNQAYIDASYKSYDDIIGCTISDLYGRETFENMIKPHIDRALTGETVYYQLWLNFEKLGRKFVSVNYSPYYDTDNKLTGVVISARDMTALRTAEQAIKKSEEKYRKIFENIPDVIYRVDSSQKIILISPSALKVFGYDSVDEIIGRDVLDTFYYNPYDRTKLMDQLKQHGKVANYPLVLKKKDETPVYVETNSYYIYDEEGNIAGVEGILRDVTERKKAEILLVEAKLAAERANKAKSEFLANMSHEIRTPLNSVLGFTELLDSMITNPKQKSYLDAIKTGGKNLLTLINDILDLSKIEAGHMEIQKEPVNVKAIFAEIAKIFSLRTAQKSIDYITEIAPGIPELLVLDETHLRQILLNLMGNAVKFTGEGFVKLTARADVKLPDRQVIDLIISVEDTGIGISKHQKEKIFEAFRQHEGQERKRYGGTGLGLAITKRLAEMMGGAVSLESTVGKGSLFKIAFKNVPVCAGEMSIAITDAPPAEESIFFVRSLVLVVDDVLENCALIREYLQDTNLNVIDAENGQEAIQFARHYQPALILMDLRMPVMDGFKATRIIKDDEQLRHIPVVAVTASTLLKDLEKVKSYGFDGFLRKPVSRGKLLNEINRFIPKIDIAAPPSFADIPPPQQLPEELPPINTELAAALENELNQSWAEVSQTSSFDKIIEFGNRIRDLGATYSLEILEEYGQALTTHADNFDVENMNAALETFPQLVKKLIR